MDRDHRPGQRGILAFGAIAVAALAACGDGGSGSSTGTAPPVAATSAAPVAAPVTHAPKRTEGSAAALSMDGRSVLVADEDHEVVFVAPTSFADLAPLRVVPMPGPPAQIVA